jgi:hypothetical protein
MNAHQDEEEVGLTVGEDGDYLRRLFPPGCQISSSDFDVEYIFIELTSMDGAHVATTQKNQKLPKIVPILNFFQTVFQKHSKKILSMSKIVLSVQCFTPLSSATLLLSSNFLSYSSVTRRSFASASCLSCSLHQFESKRHIYARYERKLEEERSKGRRKEGE